MSIPGDWQDQAYWELKRENERLRARIQWHDRALSWLADHEPDLVEAAKTRFLTDEQAQRRSLDASDRTRKEEIAMTRNHYRVAGIGRSDK